MTIHFSFGLLWSGVTRTNGLFFLKHWRVEIFQELIKIIFGKLKKSQGFLKQFRSGTSQSKRKQDETQANNNAKEKIQRGRHKKRRGEKREKEKGRESLL